MFLIFCIILSLLVFPRGLMPQGLGTLTLYFHNMCLNAAPASRYQSDYQALVCGSQLTAGDFRDGLRAVGLIHIMVVSGAHFLFLNRILKFIWSRWRVFRVLQIPILIFYAFVTLLQPPVVRSLLQMGLKKITEHLKLSWSQTHLVLLSGLITWVIFPEWIKSLSFLLSWLVSFALACPLPFFTSQKRWHSIWLRQILIYFLIFPAVMTMGFPHPVSIAANVLLAPLLGEWLFPLSAFCFFIPIGACFVDLLWQGFSFILSAIEPLTIPVPGSVQLSILTLWCYLWVLQFGILPLQTLKLRREKHGF